MEKIMQEWQKALDRYLTTPPEDPYAPFIEMVDDFLSDLFWDSNQEFIDSDMYVDWCIRLSRKPANDAAMIIERSFRRYCG